MKTQWAQNQTNAAQAQAQQQATLHQAENALREQRQQLQTMIAQLKELKASIRREQQVDVPGLARENEQLKRRLAEAHSQAESARAQSGAVEHVQRLEEENEELRRVLGALEKDANAAPAAAHAKREGD